MCFVYGVCRRLIKFRRYSMLIIVTKSSESTNWRISRFQFRDDFLVTYTSCRTFGKRFVYNRSDSLASFFVHYSCNRSVETLFEMYPNQYAQQYSQYNQQYQQYPSNYYQMYNYNQPPAYSATQPAQPTPTTFSTNVPVQQPKASSPGQNVTSLWMGSVSFSKISCLQFFDQIV